MSRRQQSKRQRQRPKAKSFEVKRCPETDKVIYKSQKQAESEINYRQVLHKHEPTPKPIRWYVCPFCDGIHLTHQPLR